MSFAPFSFIADGFIHHRILRILFFVCQLTLLKFLICEVDQEPKGLTRELLSLRAADYDPSYIMMRQGELHEKYREEEKRLAWTFADVDSPRKAYFGGCFSCCIRVAYVAFVLQKFRFRKLNSQIKHHFQNSGTNQKAAKPA